MRKRDLGLKLSKLVITEWKWTAAPRTKRLEAIPLTAFYDASAIRAGPRPELSGSPTFCEV